MKREIRMIAAGGAAGLLNSGWIVGSFNGNAVILGLCLSMGVVAVEKASVKQTSERRLPDLRRILPIALIVGILAGLTGFPVSGSLPVHFGHFTLLSFATLTALYPVFILPAFFARHKVLMTVVAGTCASLIIESFRFMDYYQRSSQYSDMGLSGFMEITLLALFSVMTRGFLFSLTWVIFMGWAGKPEKSLTPWSTKIITIATGRHL